MFEETPQRPLKGAAPRRWDLARIVLAGALLATLAVYWPGLNGPFLFDDAANLTVFRDWYNGRVDWRYAVLGRTDPLAARPLSMASFLATVALGGPEPLSYKIGNLLLHLTVGLLAFRLLLRTLAEDQALAKRARLLAAIAVTLWLLHPIQVSTVLYAVQRMAQLAALFALAATLAYWVGRRRLIAGYTRSATLLLFGVFPLLLMAGVLSKQNAVVAPALCLVLELAYFTGARPRRVLAFFGLFLALPLIAGLALLAWSPRLLLDGYADWDFSLGQRLLTQPRVLADYLLALLLPRGERMTLFSDDFALSTGWLTVPSPIPAMLVLAAISTLAATLRKRAPSLFAGWFFFLTAHAVESSVLPLEMYYEHRNYLPSIGLALAVVGAWGLLPSRWPRAPMFALPAAIAACGLLAWSTHARALIWRSKADIVANALAYHPDSLRARQTQAFIDLSAGRHDASLTQMAYLARSPLPRRRLLAGIDSVSIDCLSGRDPDPVQLDRALADRQTKITLDEVLVADLLAQASGQGRCPRISPERVIDTVSALLKAAATQPDSAQPKRQLRLLAAILLARSERWPEARGQAEAAWGADARLELADLLIQAYVKEGRPESAERVLRELTARTKSYDRAALRLIAHWRSRLAER
ncbi:hypothetical protein [Lysobacter sp. Root604]|uniref:hypothetical protein n=1 Tax=Lysobacter sp. Root604 TaxID=1736568 RepID=UPI0006F8F48C|nr:hypothetical protein [Lysobacter sp. Root604]KRA17807.1 hypothetical protein ASD69_14205 [Lysobacter sp. Root604]